MSEQKTETVEKSEKDLKEEHGLRDDSCCTLSCWNTTCTRICCKIYKDRDSVELMLEGIQLPAIQKQHIRARYINILENLKKRARKYSIVFFVGHFIITVGSLFVPALLSIQSSSTSFTLTNGTVVPVYIITFIVSLLVTIFNGILTLFKIDKKFYFLHTTMERLRSEGWQYLGLTGRYSGRSTDVPSTHENQFIFFSHQIERIKMSQVQEEFYKSDDSATVKDVRSSGQKNTEFYPLSPIVPNTVIKEVPGTIQEVVHSIMQAKPEGVRSLGSLSIEDGQIPLSRKANEKTFLPSISLYAQDIPDSVAIAIEDPTNMIVMPDAAATHQKPQ